MSYNESLNARARVPAPPFCKSSKRTLTKTLALLLLLACVHVNARAQSSQLPSPDRVVGDYVTAVGGSKRLAALRDATYEWAVVRAGAGAGTARSEGHQAEIPSHG